MSNDEKKTISLPLIAVVVAIVLAAAILPNIAITHDGNTATLGTTSKLDNLRMSVSLYKSQYSAWPPDLNVLVGAPKQLQFADRLSVSAQDGWGNQISFIPFDPKVGHGKLISLGSDGLSGGTGSAKDIVVLFGDDTMPKAHR